MWSINIEIRDWSEDQHLEQGLETEYGASHSDQHTDSITVTVVGAPNTTQGETDSLSCGRGFIF